MKQQKLEFPLSVKKLGITWVLNRAYSGGNLLKNEESIQSWSCLGGLRYGRPEIREIQTLNCDDLPGSKYYLLMFSSQEQDHHSKKAAQVGGEEEFKSWLSRT